MGCMDVTSNTLIKDGPRRACRRLFDGNPDQAPVYRSNIVFGETA